MKKSRAGLEKHDLLPGYEEGRYEHRCETDLRDLQKDLPPMKGRRDSRVSIRLHAQDLESLEKAALEEGVPVQALMARIIQSHARHWQRQYEERGGQGSKESNIQDTHHSIFRND